MEEICLAANLAEADVTRLDHEGRTYTICRLRGDGGPSSILCTIAVSRSRVDVSCACLLVAVRTGCGRGLLRSSLDALLAWNIDPKTVLELGLAMLDMDVLPSMSQLLLTQGNLHQIRTLTDDRDSKNRQERGWRSTSAPCHGDPVPVLRY